MPTPQFFTSRVGPEEKAKEKAPRDPEKMLQAYGLTENEAETFRGLPLRSRRLGQEESALLHVVGQADTVVPVRKTPICLKNLRFSRRLDQGNPQGGRGTPPPQPQEPEPIVSFVLDAWKSWRSQVSNRCHLNRLPSSSRMKTYGRSNSIRRAEPRPCPGGGIGRL